jgi:hypothetical protein
MIRLLFLLLSFATCNTLFSQSIVANDTAELGAGNSQMVFYKLADGTKTVSSNTDWHLAITVRPTQFPNAPLGGTTIRINEANGVKAIYVPNAAAADFSTLDTSGWQSWTRLHDSDTAIDEGALNSNRSSNIFDFGWGTYNSTTHNVTGDSLYLIQLPTGELKKFLVVDLDKDTAFNLQYSNIDNSDLQNLKISKKAYQGKQFVYLNLLTNVVHDKEPLAVNWDLQFLKYAANDVLPDSVYNVVGVWANKSAKVAEARGVDIMLNNYQAYTFSDKLNAIGWNWKSFNNQTFQYEITDSLAYFVQTQGSAVYKVIFTAYSGSSTGKISFYKELVSGVSGTEESNTVSVALFPNPAANYFSVVVNDNTENNYISISDLSGRVLMNDKLNASFQQYSTVDFPNGLYLVTITANGQSVIKRLVINR